MKFCKNCGYGVEDTAPVCGNCGTAMDENNTLTDEKLKTLSERIKLNGIIWIVVGALQVCSFVCVIVGVLNIISGIRDLNTSKTVFERRVGLVQAYTPIVSPVITLIYNVIFGGLIGIAGSLFYFLGIREYVMENKDYFNTLR